MGEAGHYKDLVVFLAAAGIIVPLFSRLKISPVLGFLAAGVILGPDGIGRFANDGGWLSYLSITDRSQIEVLSELGVAFLLFMIGLELSWERLRAMRKLIFGLGMAQVVVCSAVLAGMFLLMGQTLAASVVLGLGLALSSTAVVMPVLADRKKLKGEVGRASFAVLLAQDLAVAPILITVTVLAALASAGGELTPALIGQSLLTLAPAAIGLAALVFVGRLVIRPLFRGVARAQGEELFVAACLLMVVGAGVAAQAAGLSMGLGALIAGLLLAETEYRRQVEVSIEPFKGLLLGVFFIGVGIGLDLDAIATEPMVILALAAAITSVKAILIFLLARMSKVSGRGALEAALVLGPAGEFAFVILGAGMVEGIASPGFTQGVMLSATISIFAIPFLASFASWATAGAPSREPSPIESESLPEPTDNQVLIIGFGRVGRLVGEMLTEHSVPYLAIDSKLGTVEAGRRDGLPVSYGDASRADLLKRCGIDTARAVVVTMDSPAQVDEVVMAARKLRKDLILIARARDDRHAARLYGLGVTDAVPETTEASLQLAENTLVDLGVPMGLVLASIHDRRDAFRRVFQAAAPADRKGPTRALRTNTRS